MAGEPGIGKTTLVEDLLGDLGAEERCTIARGRCSERLAGTEAYLPLLEALESLLRDAYRAEMESAMRQIAPTWYAQVALQSADSEEIAQLLADVKTASQARMKRELGSFFQEVARRRPFVLFFDDLQWADGSTIDLVSFLATKLDAMNMLIVAAYRPSDMLLAKHPFLQLKPDLQARGVCRELLLEFLQEEEIAEYLELEFPGHRFPTEFPKLIHAKLRAVRCSWLISPVLAGPRCDRNGWWRLDARANVARHRTRVAGIGARNDRTKDCTTYRGRSQAADRSERARI